ncbi:B3 domain-containing protein [Cucumis melo var. makuwa]|uniref:B3 domain-containing protein n=2 Tax=Cucumis melo TaxID=3656 RepID=A0A5D3C624_CUCMM|nr:B3 domain-containing protein At3g19184 isoform X1 [Cucumis melo]TYK06742.1 B3 domain-containing protein [Cucumis melo var. makuwa]
MVESNLTYEECRRQRLEENKKRMEELNLNKLADAFKSSSPKSSPTKQLKRPRQPFDVSSFSVRRSSRFADKPPMNYKEVPIEPLPGIRRSYQRRDLLNRIYASDEERQYAIDRALDLQSSLESKYPSFVKPMLQSHVSGGFWLGLPVRFCKTHLPHEDEILTLVDEDENEFQTKYLADKTGLSGGWRGFSIDHQLVDGDALVFQLTSPTEFKVYIIRTYNSVDKEDTKEGSDATQLESSGKKNTKSSGHKTRANNSEDKGDIDEDSDVFQLEKGGKKTTRSSRCKRSANKSEDKSDTGTDSHDPQLGKTGKRITRSSSKGFIFFSFRPSIFSIITTISQCFELGCVCLKRVSNDY